MNKTALFLAVAPIALATPAFAQTAPVESDQPAAKAAKATDKAPVKEAFSTGVAKGRDLLDSAISTSALGEDEIQKLGANSLGEVLRNIPGVRVEYEGGEGNASYSIRGLPLAASGSKFMQLEEDGLPVLEFGDLQLFSPDLFLRADTDLAQVEAIRGGSASTFASNSPGGVINLISKTGETQGGSIMATTGLGYGMNRLDFDYGGRLNDTLRFQVGGFYRQGEGPRHIGYDAYKGGQFKFNVTKELGNDAYVRIYGKYLDDRTPSYQPVPINVTGTNGNPTYQSVPGFDLSRDSMLSRNINGFPSLDENNNPKIYDARQGMHAVEKSLGLEAKFDVAGWSISEKFRYAGISGSVFQDEPLAVAPAIGLAWASGGPGATLSYANGPHVGQAINPFTVNGNGLLAESVIINADLNSLNNMTNDLRANRVWDIGAGKLTLTAGYYKSNQAFDAFWSFGIALQDVAGGGNSALVNVKTAGGTTVTSDGITAFSVGSGAYHRRYNVSYDISAPYGSLNYHIGKLSVGGSVRYDIGTVRGTLTGAELGLSGSNIQAFDFNGDGVISVAESQTANLSPTKSGLVDYGYHYLSYSTGINYRFSDRLAAFARYSVGGRAAADRILFTPAIDYTSGALRDPKDGYDVVKQSEVGVKFRGDGVALNVTGFLANTGERNLQVNSAPDGSVQVVQIVRTYRAYGAEFEGSVRRGPFNLTVGATYTHAEIASDATNPTVIGNTPRHQGTVIFEATPQYETRLFTIGANLTGTTSSFAQDTNQLKLPGYTVVNGFVQVRPTHNLQLMVNANNLFDTIGIAETSQGAIPAGGGVILGRAITGRTFSASVRFTY